MAALRSLLLATLALSPLPACSRVFKLTTVGPNFQVRLTGRAADISSIPLLLQPANSNTPPAHATTDAQGLALFAAIPPGDYTLAPLHGAGAAATASIRVLHTVSSLQTVLLAWPNHPPLTTAALRGRFRVDLPPPSPLILTLRDPRTGLTLRQLNSPNGAFNFPNLTPGLYLLLAQIAGTPYGGTFAFSIDPITSTPHLALTLRLTSCGLSIAESRR